MAQTNASDDPDLAKQLSKAFQSGHLNLLLGAGASMPAVPVAGDIEREIEALQASGKIDEAKQRLCQLLETIQTAVNDALGDPAAQPVVVQYGALLRTLNALLTERRTALLPKQVTLFTTNYDVFLESSADLCSGLTVTNGFAKRPLSDSLCEFSMKPFSVTSFDTGNAYEYRVELPTVHVVKLHGCLTWHRDGDRLVQRNAVHKFAVPTTAAERAAFIERFAVVLPQSTKFRESVLERTYYDLLRLYANALDRENALLITFGFSFRDEHILHLTQRALKNPTLMLYVAAYDSSAAADLEIRFKDFDNVLILAPPAGHVLDFAAFNVLLSASIPRSAAK